MDFVLQTAVKLLAIDLLYPHFPQISISDKAL